MKRSTGVALVLMGAAAVGGTAYWVSTRDCNNVQPGTSQAEHCRSSSGSSYGGRSAFWSHQQNSSNASSYNSNSSNSAYHSNAPTVARSGFGSTSHGFSSGS
ncbi:MAG: hypothetical protein ABW151_13405 [Pseudorhodoplanes sp.]